MNTNLHTVILCVKIPNIDESGYLNPINDTTAVMLSAGCIDKSEFFICNKRKITQITKPANKDI